jgi:hypothetical protein
VSGHFYDIILSDDFGMYHESFNDAFEDEMHAITETVSDNDDFQLRVQGCRPLCSPTSRYA